jgi:hypothetical protein
VGATRYYASFVCPVRRAGNPCGIVVLSDTGFRYDRTLDASDQSAKFVLSWTRFGEIECSGMMSVCKKPGRVNRHPNHTVARGYSKAPSLWQDVGGKGMNNFLAYPIRDFPPNLRFLENFRFLPTHSRKSTLIQGTSTAHRKKKPRKKKTKRGLVDEVS